MTAYIRTKEFNANTMLALRELVNDIGTEMAIYKDLEERAAGQRRNFRNDMYVVSEAIRLMQEVRQADVLRRRMRPSSTNYKKHIDHATKFIPLWVKVAVAMALGLGHHGRMEAHRGDGRRKNRQGPSDLRAGRGGRNHRHGHDRRGGLLRFARQYHARAFVGHRRNHGRQSLRSAMGHGTQPAMAWVLTLPVAMMLSGFLFYFFRQIF